ARELDVTARDAVVHAATRSQCGRGIPEAVGAPVARAVVLRDLFQPGRRVRLEISLRCFDLVQSLYEHMFDNMRKDPMKQGVFVRSIKQIHSGPMTIDGYAATEFEPVLDAFAQNFDERGEVGASVAVYLDGQPVVDLWGG